MRASALYKGQQHILLTTREKALSHSFYVKFQYKLHEICIKRSGWDARHEHEEGNSVAKAAYAIHSFFVIYIMYINESFELLNLLIGNGE